MIDESSLSSYNSVHIMDINPILGDRAYLYMQGYTILSTAIHKQRLERLVMVAGDVLMVSYFVLSIFPRDVLDEIWD